MFWPNRIYVAIDLYYYNLLLYERHNNIWKKEPIFGGKCLKFLKKDNFFQNLYSESDPRKKVLVHRYIMAFFLHEFTVL